MKIYYQKMSISMKIDCNLITIDDLIENMDYLMNIVDYIMDFK